MKHPLNKGRLLYDHRNHEIVEIDRIQLDTENATWSYRVTDGSHTAYEKISQNEVESRFKILPLTIHDNIKSKYILDYNNLVESLEGSYGYENLDSESFTGTNDTGDKTD